MSERAKTLEQYLSDHYNDDLEDIRSIEQTLAAIAETYIATFDHTNKCWPYEITSASHTSHGKKSHGTSAMILSAIGKVIGESSLRNGATTESIPRLPKGLQEIFEAGLNGLIEQLQSAKKCVSGTFGDNDVLTISHVAELAHALRPSGHKAAAENTLSQHVSSAVDRISELVIQDPATDAFTVALRENAEVQWSPRNAFLALRVLRAHADLQGAGTFRSERFRAFFEAHLHQQLSFSAIPDSRFDPAELASCLEGLLICAQEAVDTVLFGRGLSVLRANQETSAYWRPNRPFADRPTGEIILPLSVEGANSLLRATEILDGTKLHGTFAGEAIPMFRRFWRWLRARKVEFDALGARCVGWHSEHINAPGTIHLWDTSQVIEFLVAFRALLQRHIARETLVLSGVKVDEAKQGNWSELATKYEPLSVNTLIKSPQVFERVRAHFVDPWLKHSPDRNYSMLVYGPPGTGKTSLAKSIAQALSFRLVTITVSDFLGAGGALVEARAKAIFQMLEAQSNCIIFFDEIDAFLLDRDSSHYRDQDTLFQFLTPGMLTKINDLRERERAIFIVATNYENRIDPAIKRTGRIDKRYLLLPPDLHKRCAIIKDFRKDFNDEALLRMGKAAVYLSYKDIKVAVGKDTAEDEVVERLKTSPRSSGYDVYLKRLRSETTFPYLEFLAAAEMAKEADLLNELKSAIDGLAEKDKVAWTDAVQQSSTFKQRLEELGLN